MSDRASTTTLISLAEFRQLSGLTESALVWLLEHNTLPLAYTPETGLMIDAGAATVEHLLAAIRREHGATIAQHEAVFMERIATVVNRHIGAIVDDATARLSAAPPPNKEKA
jgi:hypothetical protein